MYIIGRFGNRAWAILAHFFYKISPFLPRFYKILQAHLWGDVHALDAPATSRVLWEASDTTGDEEEWISNGAGAQRVL